MLEPPSGKRASPPISTDAMAMAGDLGVLMSCTTTRSVRRYRGTQSQRSACQNDYPRGTRRSTVYPPIQVAEDADHKTQFCNGGPVARQFVAVPLPANPAQRRSAPPRYQPDEAFAAGRSSSATDDVTTSRSGSAVARPRAFRTAATAEVERRWLTTVLQAKRRTHRFRIEKCRAEQRHRYHQANFAITRSPATRGCNSETSPPSQVEGYCRRSERLLPRFNCMVTLKYEKVVEDDIWPVRLVLEHLVRS